MKCLVLRRSVRRNVGIVAGTARLAILAEREDFVLTLGARRTVLVRTAPWILRHAFLQVGTVPLGAGAGRRGHQGVQAFFGARIAADVEAVGVERLVEGF